MPANLKLQLENTGLVVILRLIETGQELTFRFKKKQRRKAMRLVLGHVHLDGYAELVDIPNAPDGTPDLSLSINIPGILSKEAQALKAAAELEQAAATIAARAKLVAAHAEAQAKVDAEAKALAASEVKAKADAELRVKTDAEEAAKAKEALDAKAAAATVAAVKEKELLEAQISPPAPAPETPTTITPSAPSNNWRKRGKK